MTTPIEKLTKILHLEAEKYQDRAVFGGLARFADTWLREAGDTWPQAADWVQMVADRLQAYSDLTAPQERAVALQELLRLLQRGPLAVQPRPVAKPQPPVPSPPTPPAEEPGGLNAPLTALQGIGPRQARRLARLGLHSIRDFLFFFPRRYDDFSNLKPINRLEYGEEVTIVANVWDAGTRKTRGGAVLFKAVLSDGTGFIEATWFNQPYLGNRIRQGRQIVVSGKVDEYLGRLCFTSPEWEPLRRELLHTGRLVPVYPLTEGVTGRWLRGLVKRTVDYWTPRLSDHLPSSVREGHGLLDLATALRQIHFPDSHERLQEARRRLAFDELFVFQLGLLRQRYLWRSAPGRQLPIDDETL
ncbi:MAG TPA: DNA helicase RecG, partial [Chloroflexi bacterium]|nr:DNA helicase RecG [Chloroflexota bacterium]